MAESELAFYQLDPVEAARELLGYTLEHDKVSGLVVETEAYAERDDEACHTFFKKTAREFVAEHQAGAVYVYLNYGVHWLLNILTITPEGERGFVLIRALEPLTGLDTMHQRRTRKKLLRERDLCSGPGKLTQALAISPETHGVLINSRGCPYQLKPPAKKPTTMITAGPRIGITKAADLPWRFGYADNPHLSVKFPTER